LAEFIEAIEQALGKTAIKELLPMQPGDVAATFADVSELEADTGYKPATTVHTGIQRFIEWYRVYYQV
jgi:UDP-glucuronate 4-epimerase